MSVGVVPDQLDRLARTWEARDTAAWNTSQYAAHARRALALGAPGLAFDISSEARERFPSDAEAAYLAALALANAGSGGAAARLLAEALAREPGPLRPDMLSLAGRVAKERWARLPPGAARDAAGNEACEAYARAFELSGDGFPGINAATMCVLTGRASDGRRLAAEVRDRCPPDEGDAWRCATLGEASLLLGEHDAALDGYRKAAKAAGRRVGDIASMRRQLRLLAAELPGARAILELLRVPRVVVFAGHMVDAPGRGSARFPAWLEPSVAGAVADEAQALEAGFCYCSAACGADLVFAERMLARGAEVNVVLPFRKEDFLRTSVAFAGGDWTARFERVLARAATVTYCVEESHLGDDVLYRYAADLTAGLAVLRAAQLESEAVMLAVAEPGGGGGAGGTLDNIARWVALGRRSVVIDLARLRAGTAAPPAGAAGAVAPSVPAVASDAGALPWGRRQIRTLLFADMVGYSRLREHETPLFFVHFLGAIERVMAGAPSRPVFGNTWGDGLYLVFEEAGQGAEFALRLRDEIGRIDWTGAGLPAGMAIRIGMHTGPVFRTLDPILAQENYFGSHVTRAARIEPVAAPGSIYVSEQMAAALAAAGDADFACDYLGAIRLAKDFGVGRIHRLRRRMETE